MKKDILHFVKLTGLFLIGLLCADIAVGITCRYLWNKMPDDGERVAKSNFIFRKLDADVVVVGSSRAECGYVSSLMSAALKRSVYNAGTDGQGVIYQNAVVRNLLANNPPEVIIWDFTPWALFGRAEGDMELLRPQYYRCEAVKQLVDVEEQYAPVWMLSGIYRFGGGIFGRMLRVLVTPSSPTDMGYSGRPVKDWNTLGAEQVEYLGETVKATVELTEETLRMCQEQGVRMYLVISPLYAESNVSNASNRMVKLLSEKYNIPYLDYTQDSAFVHRDSLFYDMSHLNDRGARLFTGVFLKDFSKYDLVVE